MTQGRIGIIVGHVADHGIENNFAPTTEICVIVHRQKPECAAMDRMSEK